MLRFALRRLLQIVPVLLVIVTLTFFMVRFVPGGPFTAEKAVSPEILKNLNAHYGLDKPLWQQYLTYLGHLARGDLGPSFKYSNRTVNEIIAQKLPPSLELGGLALAVALIVGLPLGVLAAVRRNTWLDYVCSGIGLAGICIPTFVMGPLLALFFGIQLRWVNVSGWDYADDRILPALTLGLVYAAYLMRLTRGGMLEVLNLDYIRTARAKGVPELPVEIEKRKGLIAAAAAVLAVGLFRAAAKFLFAGYAQALILASWLAVIAIPVSLVAARFRFYPRSIILNHALRGGLQPVVSFMGPAVAGILTGSFVIETIFQIPGLGREFVNSATNRDYTLVLGLVILYGALIVVCNLIVDIVQVWLNPKLKFE